MTRTPSLVMARLDVDRGELLEGLRVLSRITKPERAGDAIMSFENGSLCVRIGGGEISAAAKGRWPGEARVPGGWVRALAEQPPPGDPLPIKVEQGRLYVAGSSILCQWQSVGAAQIELPVNATFLDVLRVGMSSADEALEESGLLERVLRARAECRDLIERAARVLKPLGVGAEDLERMVFEHLRGEAGGRAQEEDR